MEYLDHLVPARAPDDLVVITAEIPDELATTIVEAEDLPTDWRMYPAPEHLARLGADWVRSAATAVLCVPSAIVPQESNYLLNPAHRDFKKVRLSAPEPFSFDPRLWTGARR
jgi:RES domain-containing protein